MSGKVIRGDERRVVIRREVRMRGGSYQWMRVGVFAKNWCTKGGRVIG